MPPCGKQGELPGFRAIPSDGLLPGEGPLKPQCREILWHSVALEIDLELELDLDLDLELGLDLEPDTPNRPNRVRQQAPCESCLLRGATPRAKRKNLIHHFYDVSKYTIGDIRIPASQASQPEQPILPGPGPTWA